MDLKFADGTLLSVDDETVRLFHILQGYKEIADGDQRAVIDLSAEPRLTRDAAAMAFAAIHSREIVVKRLSEAVRFAFEFLGVVWLKPSEARGKVKNAYNDIFDIDEWRAQNGLPVRRAPNGAHLSKLRRRPHFAFHVAENEVGSVNNMSKIDAAHLIRHAIGAGDEESILAICKTKKWRLLTQIIIEDWRPEWFRVIIGPITHRRRRWDGRFVWLLLFGEFPKRGSMSADEYYRVILLALTGLDFPLEICEAIISLLGDLVGRFDRAYFPRFVPPRVFSRVWEICEKKMPEHAASISRLFNEIDGVGLITPDMCHIYATWLLRHLKPPENRISITERSYDPWPEGYPTWFRLPNDRRFHVPCDNDREIVAMAAAKEETIIFGKRLTGRQYFPTSFVSFLPLALDYVGHPGFAVHDDSIAINFAEKTDNDRDKTAARNAKKIVVVLCQNNLPVYDEEVLHRLVALGALRGATRRILASGSVFWVRTLLAHDAAARSRVAAEREKYVANAPNACVRYCFENM